MAGPGRPHILRLTGKARLSHGHIKGHLCAQHVRVQGEGAQVKGLGEGARCVQAQAEGVRGARGAEGGRAGSVLGHHCSPMVHQPGPLRALKVQQPHGQQRLQRGSAQGRVLKQQLQEHLAAPRAAAAGEGSCGVEKVQRQQRGARMHEQSRRRPVRGVQGAGGRGAGLSKEHG